MMDCVLLVSALAFTMMPAGVWGRPQLPAPTGPSAPGLHGPIPFVAAATGPASAPASQPQPAPLPVPSPFMAPVKTVSIVQQHFEQAPDGQYRWNYATSEGATQEAIGVLTDAPSIAVEGSYAYQSPEGQYQVHYIADEFGFQPTGSHIHPAIIEAVRKQVEFARSEPADLYNEAGFPVAAGGGGGGALGQLGQLGPAHQEAALVPSGPATLL